MNEEKQRIAIAQACGYRLLPAHQNPSQKTWRLSEGGAAEILPDYLNDLNAMHEAEKVLTNEQSLGFMVALCPILGLTGEGKAWYDLECHEAWKVTHATAAQRAEAFLRTIGKWEDGE